MVSKLMFTEVLDQKWSIDKTKVKSSLLTIISVKAYLESDPAVPCISSDELT
jgi:hypothetical protein